MDDGDGGKETAKCDQIRDVQSEIAPTDHSSPFDLLVPLHLVDQRTSSSPSSGKQVGQHGELAMQRRQS
jgi:hypothetical protein